MRKILNILFGCFFGAGAVGALAASMASMWAEAVVGLAAAVFSVLVLYAVES